MHTHTDPVQWKAPGCAAALGHQHLVRPAQQDLARQLRRAAHKVLHAQGGAGVGTSQGQLGPLLPMHAHVSITPNDIGGTRVVRAQERAGNGRQGGSWGVCKAWAALP